MDVILHCKSHVTWCVTEREKSKLRCARRDNRDQLRLGSNRAAVAGTRTASGKRFTSEPRDTRTLNHLPLFSSPLDSTLTGEAHFPLAVPHGSFQPPVTFKIPRLSCSGYPRSQVARPTTGCEGPHSRGRWYRLRTSYAYSVLTPHGLPHDERFRLFAVKNAVLAGFGHITLLDLDTIDLSNLNRQFLFRKKDVKQSKALVRRFAQCSFVCTPIPSRFRVSFRWQRAPHPHLTLTFTSRPFTETSRTRGLTWHGSKALTSF